MYTETLDKLKERARLFWQDRNNPTHSYTPEDYLLYIIELAYDSGHHDGFYDAVEKGKGAKHEIHP